MRATMMYEAGDVRIENVPDAGIQDPTDAPSPSQRAAYVTRYSRHLLDSVRPAIH